MIKLEPISEKDKQDFLKDINGKFVNWCASNIFNKAYQPLFRYLLNGNSSPNFDQSRVEQIIIGNRNVLKRIIGIVRHH